MTPSPSWQAPRSPVRLSPVDRSPETVLASGDLAFLAYQRLAP